MTVTIFGATGMVGKELVKQCLEKGYHVRAFGRNVFTAGFMANERLDLVKGALFDEDEVFHAVKGCDIVFSAIGGSLDGADHARSLGMQNIARQMEKAGVSRIIAVGGMGVLDDGNGGHLLHNPGYPAQFKAVGEEHLKAWSTLDNSGLDYTFVCCPDITAETATASYITSADITPAPNLYRITKGDLASFMIKETAEGKYRRKRVGISNS